MRIIVIFGVCVTVLTVITRGGGLAGTLAGGAAYQAPVRGRMTVYAVAGGCI